MPGIKEIMWDDPEKKYSHEGKPLSVHLREVANYHDALLSFYGINDTYALDILRFVREHHDDGKLASTWNIKIPREKRHPHAPLSLIKLNVDGISFSNNRRDDVLARFLIYRHHSNLRVPDIRPGKSGYRVFPMKDAMLLMDSVPRLGWETVVNLADGYGLFKVADAISASGKNLIDMVTRTVSIDPEYIYRVTGKSEAKIDEKRLNEQRILSYIDENIAMLRAYTGWGKTTSCLMYFTNSPLKRVFMILPTITAINKLHGSLSKAFPSVGMYYHMYIAEAREDDEALENIFFIKNFSINTINITTVDQVLLTFLQVGRYHVKRVFFRDSGMVIDEAHLLSPTMLKAILYFINRYMDLYKFRVLFMSATMPKYLVEYITMNLDRPYAFLDYSSGYRKLRRVMFKHINGMMEDAIDDIISDYESGERVIVVLNTVGRAINVFRRIRERIGNKEDVILMHSRFMYRRRRSVESLIFDMKDKNEPHILVTTQVCEVSLDISYDKMYTEVAPIQSLIQRFGRVNRYAGPGEFVERENVFIVDAPSYEPYIEDEVERAREVIDRLQGDSLRNEMDLIEELDNLYTTEEFAEMVERNAVIDTDGLDRLNLFSLDLGGNFMRNILRPNSGATVLGVPEPETITDDALRGEVADVARRLDEDRMNMRLRAEFMSYAVPIPMWLFGGFEGRFARLKNAFYHPIYGICETT